MSQKPEPEETHHETTLDDVKQLGLWAAFGSLGYVFWVVGGMELIERQVFLAMNSENKRLQFLIHHLESLLPLLLSKKTVEELAKNDGYVQE